MPNHIFINRESGNDNISIFYDEPSFVVIANKDDLTSIQLIDGLKSIFETGFKRHSEPRLPSTAQINH